MNLKLGRVLNYTSSDYGSSHSNDVTEHPGRADLYALKVPVGLPLGGAVPMCLEGLPACKGLVQHDRVGFLLRHEYLELQGLWLGCEAAFGMCFEVLQIFLPLSRTGFDGHHQRQFAHAFGPHGTTRQQLAIEYTAYTRDTDDDDELLPLPPLVQAICATILPSL